MSFFFLPPGGAAGVASGVGAEGVGAALVSAGFAGSTFAGAVAFFFAA